jgi:hypothetical protein
MLSYKDKKFTLINEEIKKNETILFLDSDVDANIFAVILLNHEVEKVLQFSKINSTYQGLLILDEIEVDLIDKPKIYLSFENNGLVKNSSIQPLTIDKLAVKATFKKKTNSDMADILKRVASVEQKLKTFMANKKIALNGGECFLPENGVMSEGMMPVVNSKGTFSLAFPFFDVVKQINGVHAIDGIIKLKANDIPYGNATVEDAIAYCVSSVVALKDGLAQTSKTQKEILKRLTDLELKFEDYTNSGIL